MWEEWDKKKQESARQAHEERIERMKLKRARVLGQRGDKRKPKIEVVDEDETQGH